MHLIVFPDTRETAQVPQNTRYCPIPPRDGTISDSLPSGLWPAGRPNSLGATVDFSAGTFPVFVRSTLESCVGTKKTGKGRRKLGRKKRRMRSKIRHRK